MNRKLKKIESGSYSGYVFYGLYARVVKDGGAWTWVLTEGENGNIVTCSDGTKSTKKICELEISKYGRETTTKVTNIMNGKEVELELAEVGGPCDPSTERYWAM